MLFMYHYYIEKGIPLSELEGLSPVQLDFMMASMILTGEEVEKHGK